MKRSIRIDVDTSRAVKSLALLKVQMRPWKWWRIWR